MKRSKLPKIAREGLSRALGSRDFQKLKPGQALVLAWPAGWAAESLLLVKLPRKASVTEARKAGATIGAGLGKGETLVLEIDSPGGNLKQLGGSTPAPGKSNADDGDTNGNGLPDA